MPEPTSMDPAYSPGHSVEPSPASGGASQRHPLRTVVIILVLLGLGAVIAWRIHSSQQAAQQEVDKTSAAAHRATPVQTALVQQRTVPVFLTALGTVTAYNTVTVNARVSGQLLRVNFREGQNVRKGQLLMEIDPAPYKAALDQALGQLAKDEANQKNTAAEAQRYTALFNAGVVSKEQEQLQTSNEGQAAGSIKADQAAIEAARVNLNYTRIYSPIDGVVGLRLVDPGNIVNAGTTSTTSSTGGSASGLVVITQIHPIAIIFTLPEDQLQQVQRAMKASAKPLVVEAYDRSDAHKIATGSLLTIDNQIDTTTGTAKLKAVFANPDNALFTNQFVNVRLILSERANAIVVPTAAISSGTQGDFVYIVNPGPTPPDKMKNLPNHGQAAAAGTKPKPTPAGAEDDADSKQRAPFHADAVPVHVDFVIGTNSVLSDGAVEAGQQVIVDGQEKLVDGSLVQPMASKSRSGGAGTAAQPQSASTPGGPTS